MVTELPLLLTPGPLTTTEATKVAMLRDWGSRDKAFIELTAMLRHRLVDLINGRNSYTCVPIAGTGTSAIEAMMSTLIHPKSHSLLLVNGEYGRRIAKMLTLTKKSFIAAELDESIPFDNNAVTHLLDSNSSIDNVILVHCETTTGLLNRLPEISELASKRKKKLFVDAMSSFGAISIDTSKIKVDAIAASSNKCLEGVPGLAFVLAKKSLINKSAGISNSLTLDLHDQWQGLEGNGQWRFTPPTQVVAALNTALDLLDSEGGMDQRYERYSENCQVLISGMRKLGFHTYLKAEDQAPIIVTFHMPKDINFTFQAFYDFLAKRGFLIYPGKLTKHPSFRIGCIGHVKQKDFQQLLSTVEKALKSLGVKLPMENSFGKE